MFKILSQKIYLYRFATKKHSRQRDSRLPREIFSHANKNLLTLTIHYLYINPVRCMEQGCDEVSGQNEGPGEQMFVHHSNHWVLLLSAAQTGHLLPDRQR